MGEYENEVLTDDALRELAEVASQLTELEQSPGFQTFRELVQLEYGKRQARVLQGRPTSMETYQRELGFIEGAMAALQIPENVRARYRSEMEVRDPRPEPEDEEAAAYAAY